jgi:hypothetical protein
MELSLLWIPVINERRCIRKAIWKKGIWKISKIEWANHKLSKYFRTGLTMMTGFPENCLRSELFSFIYVLGLSWFHISISVSILTGILMGFNTTLLKCQGMLMSICLDFIYIWFPFDKKQ